MEYLSIQDYADKWNISKRRIQILCKDGRIDGAKRIGNMWLIPDNAARPTDARLKTPMVTETLSDGTSLRRELKRVLRTWYNLAEELSDTETGKRERILVALAAGLCGFFIGIDNLTDCVQQTICKDLTGDDKNIISPVLLQEVLKFIENNRMDPELDNLLSWAYQYLNYIAKGNKFSQTQFFTEKYMIDYLISQVGAIDDANKIVDPCVGGGNFLVEALSFMCMTSSADSEECIISVIENAKKLYGFDIDSNITRIALVNIRLRALEIVNRALGMSSFDIWTKICPHIYKSITSDDVRGSLAVDDYYVIDIVENTEYKISDALGNADVILTNPPFATVKGMSKAQKDFLKLHYPEANCDMCVSYFKAIYRMLKPLGVCGIVSQNSWMYLKTFKTIRNWITKKYVIMSIANLGSGAFLDLSGEKSNVALLTVRKEENCHGDISVIDLNQFALGDKRKYIVSDERWVTIPQDKIDGANGYDFSEHSILNEIKSNMTSYSTIAVPMQGTSTGNAKELVGYFWEHFGEREWISVSNGGGYCRWQGLNNSVVKWGTNGEYIKEQKGSALRNVKYFGDTKMVFSDTGTAGLNVRVLLDNQIFIASGPGIRITNGNEYAHIALLNSRLASYCLKMMSPKLTIAAGYIGRIPITDTIGSSVILEKNAKLCIELKQKYLSTRPNNLEYNPELFQNIPSELEMAAWWFLNEDITNELLKLEIENKIDQYIFNEYGLTIEDQEQINSIVGNCAYSLDSEAEIDLKKLDKYMGKMLDAACCLKRTRVSKNTLGCDGILEYMCKDLCVSPEKMVKCIQRRPFVMETVLEKYRDLILHNIILNCLGYNTESGVSVDCCHLQEIIEKLRNSFGTCFDYKGWIELRFNTVHNEIFRGVPYLVYLNGVIQKNDRRDTGTCC